MTAVIGSSLGGRQVATSACWMVAIALIFTGAVLENAYAQSGAIPIYNINQLDSINTNLGGDYVLENNIDATSTATLNGGVGFLPIGSLSTPFTGELSGDGFTINGLSITSPTSDLGLFGTIGAGGSVTGLGLTNVNIQATGSSQNVGALVGENFGSVSNSIVTGSVTANYGFQVGGLVGANSGSIVGANSTVTVNTGVQSGESSLTSTGGLVGINLALGTITNSSASGPVSGATVFVGGLVGSGGGTITSSSASGNVLGSAGEGVAFVGGLAGDIEGQVEKVSATGNVTGDATTYVGGLAGRITTGASTQQSFATGSVTGGTNSYVGGLIGWISDSAIRQSYATGTVTGNNSTYVGGLVGITGSPCSGPGCENVVTLDQVYSTGLVHGTATSIGGLVGANFSNFPPSVTGYWDVQTSGQPTSAVGTGLNTATFKSGSLPSGFDPTAWTATVGQYPTLTANPPGQSPPPSTILTLALASLNVYSGDAAPAGYTFLNDSCSSTCGSTGLRAAAYISNDGSQIIIAIRGTDLNSFLAAIRNIDADGTFLNNVPTSEFSAAVSAAASFVQSIASAYPNATIDLTGHSLGGAIAQLLGAASGLTTVVFDAPESGALLNQLTVQLGPVNNLSAASGNGPSLVNIDYRLYGDQISLFGSNPIGAVVTIVNPAGDKLVDADPSEFFLESHDLVNLIAELSPTTPITPALTVGPNDTAELEAGIEEPSQIITNLDPAGIVVLETLGFLVDNTISYYYPDPSLGTDFIFTGNPGSPSFACLDLPSLPGVATYNVRVETGNTWSNFSSISGGGTTCFGAGTDGVEFLPVDALGDGVLISNDFLFGISFDSTGAFSGTLTELEPDQVPEPPTVLLLGASALLFALTRLKRGCGEHPSV